jgi:hypothetical protein
MAVIVTTEGGTMTTSATGAAASGSSTTQAVIGDGTGSAEAPFTGPNVVDLRREEWHGRRASH